MELRSPTIGEIRLQGAAELRRTAKANKMEQLRQSVVLDRLQAGQASEPIPVSAAAAGGMREPRGSGVCRDVPFPDWFRNHPEALILGDAGVVPRERGRPSRYDLDAQSKPSNAGVCMVCLSWHIKPQCVRCGRCGEAHWPPLCNQEPTTDAERIAADEDWQLFVSSS